MKKYYLILASIIFYYVIGKFLILAWCSNPNLIYNGPNDIDSNFFKALSLIDYRKYNCTVNFIDKYFLACVLTSLFIRTNQFKRLRSLISYPIVICVLLISFIQALFGLLSLIGSFVMMLALKFDGDWLSEEWINSEALGLMYIVICIQFFKHVRRKIKKPNNLMGGERVPAVTD